MAEQQHQKASDALKKARENAQSNSEVKKRKRAYTLTDDLSWLGTGVGVRGAPTFCMVLALWWWSFEIWSSMAWMPRSPRSLSNALFCCFKVQPFIMLSDNPTGCFLQAWMLLWLMATHYVFGMGLYMTLVLRSFPLYGRHMSICRPLCLDAVAAPA